LRPKGWKEREMGKKEDKNKEMEREKELNIDKDDV
jgi:hypothetical protein